MWRRRQPASLGKAILVAVKAWRLLHVQLHAAAKKTVIGRRLCVYWPDDSQWYCGIINDFDTKDDKHLVHYDDDKDEWLLLKDEIVHIFHSAEEVRLAARTPPRLAWSSAPACPDPLTPTTTPIHHPFTGIHAGVFHAFQEPRGKALRKVGCHHLPVVAMGS